MSFFVNRVDAQFALSSRYRRRRNVQHDIVLAPLLDPSGQRCGIEGGGEGVALTDIAAAFMQSGPTCHRLDAFGHYLHIEFVPELHACAHHARHIAIAFAITYEQFVDFQLAERHTGKRRK